MRARFPAAALVEEEHVVARRIEELPMDRADPAARSAMQEDRRLSLRIAADLPIDAVAIADVEHARLARLDRAGKRCEAGGRESVIAILSAPCGGQSVVS